MKKISAGLILTDKQKFLGCHVTGQRFYDIPKGGIEFREAAIDACIREVKEETNLNISHKDLIDLGVFDYNPVKNLHLFLKIVDNFPNTGEMACTSTFFDDVTNSEKLEVDGYHYISFGEKEKYVTKNMAKVLSKVEQILMGP